jgi:hypothetical protein
MNWIELKDFSNESLASARKQLHQAAQLPAIASRCLNPKDSGDNLAALIWDKSNKMLISPSLGESEFRTALDIADFQLAIINEKGESVNSLDLNTKTYDEAFNWLAEILKQLGLYSYKLNKNLPYQIPEYPTAKGRPFKNTNPAAFTELQNYYSNAAFILENLSKKEKNISPVRCWPHHFDIAILITIERNPDPEKSKTIGVGLSPGDDSYTEPYFYISPWPYPEDKDDLPKLDYGHWHKHGWFGGVLTSTDIICHKDKSEQLKIVECFVYAGINNLNKLL